MVPAPLPPKGANMNTFRYCSSRSKRRVKRSDRTISGGGTRPELTYYHFSLVAIARCKVAFPDIRINSRLPRKAPIRQFSLPVPPQPPPVCFVDGYAEGRARLYVPPSVFYSKHQVGVTVGIRVPLYFPFRADYFGATEDS